MLHFSALFVAFRLSKQVKSHVGVGLFFGRFFLLLFSWGSFSSSATGSGTSSWGGTDSGANVGDQTGNIAALEGGGEKSWPEWFDGDTGGFDDLVQVVGIDFDVRVVEDQSGVGAGEFRVCHFWRFLIFS